MKTHEQIRAFIESIQPDNQRPAPPPPSITEEESGY